MEQRPELRILRRGKKSALRMLWFRAKQHCLFPASVSSSWMQAVFWDA